MSGPPTAVLLDVGGVFLLPQRSHIRSALSRCGHPADDDHAIDRAHYLAARVFPMDLGAEGDLGPYWDHYLETYARALAVPEETVPEAVEHLRNEYVSGGLWAEVIEGAREGLESLVSTGVPVGVVSNSDGTIERRLRAMGVLQVGPGEGIEVLCLIDSGSVGVEKPDPRIFDHAFESLGVARNGAWYVGDTPAFDVVGARRAGLHPILMDPFDVNADFGAKCVRSLSEVAEMIDSLSS